MATMVMTLAITTCITTMQRGFLSLDTARNLTTAGQILQCEVEKMRMSKWEEIKAYDPTLDPMPLDPIFSSNPAIASHFTLRRDTKAVPTSTGVGMRQLTFTVSWKSYDGRTQARNYTTYYGEHGLYDYYYNQL